MSQPRVINHECATVEPYEVPAIIQARGFVFRFGGNEDSLSNEKGLEVLKAQ